MTVLKNIPQPRKLNILLIGDDCTDVYQYGVVDRISPEAPVPVFKLLNSITKPGMAGNVRENLLSLGCEVSYLHGHTSKKTRLIDKRSNQHILRIDDDVLSEPLTFDTLIPPFYDAIVISDYNKGTVSYELIESIIDEVNCPVFVDTKKTDLKRLEGSVVKINNREFEESISQCGELIVTTGSKGAVYKNMVFEANAVDVVDVTGAGDTFLAALVYRFLHTNDIQSSIRFAIKASELTVKHMGVYAPTLEELCV
jgi:D-beta-D-heptose 7-phosphate kinase/D-beta-D-heptose 1-phosphate adenosyltransferase